MQAVELPWETWRTVIAVLREKAPPHMQEHANLIEEQLERHAPDLVARLVGSRRLVAVSSHLAQLNGVRSRPARCRMVVNRGASGRHRSR